MFVGIITSTTLNEGSVSFRMFGKSRSDGELQHKTFTMEGNRAEAARIYLECIDNERYCYVFNQYGDDFLNRYLWNEVNVCWRVKGLGAAAIKNGKATVVF